MESDAAPGAERLDLVRDLRQIREHAQRTERHGAKAGCHRNMTNCLRAIARDLQALEDHLTPEEIRA